MTGSLNAVACTEPEGDPRDSSGQYSSANYPYQTVTSSRTLNDYWYSPFFHASAVGIGGGASLTLSGGRRSKLVFHPDPNNPNDSPDEYIYVKIKGNLYGSAIDYDAPNSTHSPGGESVSTILSVDDGDTVFHKTTGELVSNAGATVSTTNLETVVKIPTYGLVEVWTPYLKVNAVAKLTSSNRVTTSINSRGGSDLVWRSGGVNVDATYESSLTNYYVEISSDIEKSYYKGDGDRPDIYSQLKTDGSFQYRYDSQQVAGLETPNDTSDDIWKLECIRNRDGSMTVEKAVRWDSLAQFWRADVNLSAHPVGYTNPDFLWTKAGGGSIDPSNVAIGGGWNISGTNHDMWFYNTDPTPSTFSVSVKNQDNSAPTTDNEYTANWHYPLEPYHKRQNIYTFDFRKELSDIDDGAYFGDTSGNTESDSNPYQTEDSSFLPVVQAFLDAIDDASDFCLKAKSWHKFSQNLAVRQQIGTRKKTSQKVKALHDYVRCLGLRQATSTQW